VVSPVLKYTERNKHNSPIPTHIHPDGTELLRHPSVQRAELLRLNTDPDERELCMRYSETDATLTLSPVYVHNSSYAYGSFSTFVGIILLACDTS